MAACMKWRIRCSCASSAANSSQGRMQREERKFPRAKHAARTTCCDDGADNSKVALVPKNRHARGAARRGHVDYFSRSSLSQPRITAHEAASHSSLGGSKAAHMHMKARKWAEPAARGRTDLAIWLSPKIMRVMTDGAQNTTACVAQHHGAGIARWMQMMTEPTAAEWCSTGSWRLAASS